MDQIKLGVFPALSHSWHKHSDSWLVVRAIKTLVNGIKAFFGGYSVSVVDKTTPKLVEKHPNAWFSKVLHKPLSAYSISIPSACKSSSSYVSDKVTKLDHEGRKLQVKLAFKQDGSVAAIPMYFSDNPWFPSNLNGAACRSSGDAEAPGKKIVCRHFSWAYATKVFGRGKDTFATIDSREKIRSTFANTSNTPCVSAHYHPDGSNTLNKTQSHFADGYYFREGKFSEALNRLVSKYWGISDGAEKNFLFDTKKHSMALRLKKQDGCMKVIFYEPNDTLRHKTFLLSEPDLAAYITTKDLKSDHIGDAGLVNIGDRKESVEECDVQCIGTTPSEFGMYPLPGHDNHETFRKRRGRGIGR
ncbi:ShET2/EspL2 family type III secretion system effector toxin [Endozoicomonas elysicola]|uniref:ShET2 enterotoxin N-terminal domain-containing protein n=1 Tax=Endozoicomonas elysicola TaxID=305900 RepID=A0A081K8I3_9GAMM|nr:ShET2/EspL2 family type III secretion system effector toxin [Endozoicomonas elysicola]KEI70459.1 hypothetical protein GV64_06675 [Endozoicomonas elysicola]